MEDAARRLLREKAENDEIVLADLSRKLGKNHAYLQQFVKRGVPVHLPEKVRIDLAALLQIDEKELGAPRRRVVPAGQEFEPDPVFDPYGGSAVAKDFNYEGALPGASPEVSDKAGLGLGQIENSERVVHVGNGDIVTGHRVTGEWVLPPTVVRHELHTTPGRMWVVPVIGDSMSPTLRSGDRVFVDTTHTRLAPDGLYVIDEGDGPMVKRLHRIRDSDPPAAEIISDNEHHPRFARTMDRFTIIGRVCGRFEVM